MYSLQHCSNKTLLKTPITNQYQQQKQTQSIVPATVTTTTTESNSRLPLKQNHRSHLNIESSNKQAIKRNKESGTVNP
ncbi:hypothetical protein DOY81_004580 [Sarcophaga bullata]|nr:hypothetical protein DOY81_004580 [Sarcophaga bullata]